MSIYMFNIHDIETSTILSEFTIGLIGGSFRVLIKVS